MQHRARARGDQPARGRCSRSRSTRVEAAYADLLESLPATRRAAADVTDIGWMVEELRVSLFAQSLGTADPVSEKRVRTAIAAVAASALTVGPARQRRRRATSDAVLRDPRAEDRRQVARGRGGRRGRRRRAAEVEPGIRGGRRTFMRYELHP